MPFSQIIPPSPSPTELFGLLKKNYIYIYIYIYLADWVLVMEPGLFSCGMQDLAPCPGTEPWPLDLGAPSLNHWTTREVSGLLF